MSSGNIFRWAIGLGLTGLQVLAIEWCARLYVNSERRSVDRRGAAGDYNRPFKTGRVVPNRPAPTTEEIAEDDRHMAFAYRMLVAVASFIAAIGGVRVVVLGKRAALTIFEAALFGVIVGVILGVLVVLMARLYCRGNLLDDRLSIEREAMAGLDENLQVARAAVAEEREKALVALAEADLQSMAAQRIREQTVADYWSALQLAWSWFGLPHNQLDFPSFQHDALPVVMNSEPIRNDLRAKLDRVNAWLADRPTVFDRGPATALLPEAGADAPTTRFMPLHHPHQPPGRQVVVVGPQPVVSRWHRGHRTPG